VNEVAVARPRVLTVIVSYNFEPWIERCLSSIRDSDYPSDLVVIDNASTDRTVSIIAERYRWIRLVRSRKNLGFGQANNIGMRMALEEDYDYVFLVNQDAWIEANTVGTLVGLAEKYPDYQWKRLLDNSVGTDISKFAGEVKPIIETVPNFFDNTASSPLFETKIGKAKLLFCGFDLDGDYPECKQLLSSITQYVNSDKF